MKKTIALALLLGTVLFVITLVLVIRFTGKNQPGATSNQRETDQRTGIGIKSGGKAGIETVKDKDGGKAETEKDKGPDEVLSTENLVKLAREAGSKYRNIPPDCKVSIRDEDTKFVVTFIQELPPDTAGGDYYAKVTVDKQTSQVLQVLVSP